MRYFLLLILTLSSVLATPYSNSELLKKVKDGELDLICEDVTGKRKINGRMVRSYDGFKWHLTNGKSLYCEVKEGWF